MEVFISLTNKAISINTSTPLGDPIMRLNEIAEDLHTGLTKRNNAETAKQKAAYAKSSQAWYQLQKAQSEEMKARQRFIQAAVASASSRCQP
jgi:sensor histidine kinase YesM